MLKGIIIKEYKLAFIINKSKNKIKLLFGEKDISLELITFEFSSESSSPDSITSEYLLNNSSF